jgi:uncharacterized protein YegJ (DUF2314 family)
MTTKTRRPRITLLDGVMQNARHPDTFEIPDERTRTQLRPGDLVKLSFHQVGCDVAGERMWVRVGFKTGDTTYVGLLNNVPSFIEGLLLGDRVDFDQKNVISFQSRDDEEAS